VPKVWLITGSSGSLGPIAKPALAAADKVLPTAREPARLQDLVHCYGSRIRTVQDDIRNASVAATALQIAVDAFDGLDVVVNAARSADLRLKTSASRASAFLSKPISSVSRGSGVEVQW